ncbi:hypothetical protein GTO10_06645 [Candidatus Saccharibacteria bacterium]|nr:hypothetical protein [Candidatus Saccharibacteria bacterium]
MPKFRRGFSSLAVLAAAVLLVGGAIGLSWYLNSRFGPKLLELESSFFEKTSDLESQIAEKAKESDLSDLQSQIDEKLSDPDLTAKLPWGDEDVSNVLTLSNYLPLSGSTLTGTLTVSGVSGLTEADLPAAFTAANALKLGGEAGSYYLNASNLSSGTLSLARLPDLSSLYLSLSGGALAGNLGFGGANITDLGLISFFDSSVQTTAQSTAATLIVCASDAKNTGRCDYKSDGTDDQVQIQAAINALPSGGGRIVLSEGNFQITAPIDKRSDLVIEGQGKGTHFVAQNRTTVFFTLAGSASNITLRDFSIDGRGDDGVVYGGSPIDLQGIERFLVENVYVYSGAGHGIRVSDNSKYGVVTKSTVEEAWDDCFSVDGPGVFGITVFESVAIRCKVAWSTHPGLAQSAFEVDDGPENVLIKDSIAVFAGDGRIGAVHHHAGEAVPKNVVFDGITTEGTLYIGIEIMGVESVTVRNSRFRNITAVGVDMKQGEGATVPKNVSITNNEFEGITSAAIRIPASTGAENITIANNRIYSSSNVAGAIELHNASGVLLYGNIVGSVPRALQTDSVTNLTVIGNFLKATGTTGTYTIYAPSLSNATIAYNSIEHDSLTVSHSALSVSGSRVRVIGNLIRAGWGGVIATAGSGNGFEIKNNDIEAQLRPIQFISGANHVVSSNRLKQYSVDVTTDYNIKFDVGDYHVVASNYMEGWRGVRFADGTANHTFTGNNVVDVASTHVYPTTTVLVLKDNVGFRTESSGTGTVLSGNTFRDIAHGLAITPSINNIHVTPTNNLGNAAKFWISNVGSVNFRINVDVDPGASTATFSWTVVSP